MPDLPPVDLAALDAFLMSDRAPDGSMGLSDLDGFVSGIVVGPEIIMPSEWLSIIWGGEEPAFESIEEARSILRVITGRYNEIARALNGSFASMTHAPALFCAFEVGDRDAIARVRDAP